MKTNKKRLNHGICNPHIFLSKENVNDLYEVEKVLLKYFPKYLMDLANIDYFYSNVHLRNRIKSIKLIKRMFCEEYEGPHKDYWRLDIANKRKTVQQCVTFENDAFCDGNFRKHDKELLKTLPNLKRIFLGFNDDEDFDDICEQNRSFPIPKICNYLNRMTNLKYLHLSCSPKFLFPLLSKLNSNENLLSHLVVFKIDWWRHNACCFFKALLKSKNVLKYLTGLNMNTIYGKGSCQVLQLISNHCQRLTSLTLTTSDESVFGLEEFEASSDNPSLEEDWFFPLKSLRKLSISTENSLDFFKYYRFPKELSHLHLDFLNIDWQKLIDTSISVFHHKQKGSFLNLEQLSINIHRFERQQDQFVTQTFLQGFFTNISTLKELKLFLSPSQFFRSGSTSKPFTLFDFTDFLRSIQHLSQSLETLTVENLGRNCYFYGSELTVPDFPKLSSLSITGLIQPFLAVEKVLALKLANSEGSLPVIRLDEVSVDSNKGLFDVICKLAEVKGIMKKRVEMVISHSNQGGDDQYFEENYERVKNEIRGLKNVFLKIKVCVSLSAFKWKKELETFEPCFGKLEIITIL